MAEQVVNIRERIEKMRTQIYDKTDINKSIDSSNKNVSTNDHINTDENTILDKNKSKKPQSSINSQDKEEILSKNEIKNNIKNTIVEISKENKLKDLQENKEFVHYKEEIRDKPLETDYVKSEENNNYFDRNKKVEYAEPQFKKSSNKSYKDYQLNNLVDENKENVNLEDKSQSFPQFSLNVNNPISWKLMLLIMLMQLLTNVMLVVVLYLK